MNFLLTSMLASTSLLLTFHFNLSTFFCLGYKVDGLEDFPWKERTKCYSKLVCCSFYPSAITDHLKDLVYTSISEQSHLLLLRHSSNYALDSSQIGWQIARRVLIRKTRPIAISCVLLAISDGRTDRRTSFYVEENATPRRAQWSHF